jgi:predicted MFS family arabinose efflux permease
LYATAQRIGSTAAYLLFGALVASLGYRKVFLVCTSFCAVALVLLIACRRTEPAPAALARAA